MLKRRTIAEYASMLANLFPPGQAWSRSADSGLINLNRSAAVELTRIDGEAHRLLAETNPASTVEALTDWERVTGLPDQCSTLATTFEERRGQVLIKLVRPVGQHAAYYKALAKTLGYASPQVEEFVPFRAGSRAGDRINQAPGGVYLQEADGESAPVQSDYHGWLYTWRLNLDTTAVRYFRAGQSRADDRLSSWGDKLIECIVKRFKPAHTIVIFAYGAAAAEAIASSGYCEYCGDA